MSERMRVIDWRGKPGLPKIQRAPQDSISVQDTVQAIIDDVRKRGAAAIKEQALRFDGVELGSIKVPLGAIRNALDSISQELREAITEAISRVREVSRAQLPEKSSLSLTEGATVTTRWVPMARAGLYVPGGKATYPSSLIMNVVPAQEAKVSEIVLATPAPINSVVLATAALLGVEHIYQMGGAGAVAALAYGLPEEGLDPVNIITGPGNVFVSTAKLLVSGVVAIDSEAGPSEVLIVADSTANPAHIAADLLSQAEHDENAVSILITTDEAQIDAVQDELKKRLNATQNSKRARAALFGQQSVIVLVDDLDIAVALANEYAAEHTEIQTEDAAEVAERITNAGAVFVGAYSPVSLGDYLAGSNHVLPTSGKAKYRSGLSAATFLRSQQLIEYSAPALAEVSKHIEVFADHENLPAHSEAVQARFEDEISNKAEDD